MGRRVLTCLGLQLVHHLCRPGIPRILYTKQKVMPDLPVLQYVLKSMKTTTVPRTVVYTCIYQKEERMYILNNYFYFTSLEKKCLKILYTMTYWRPNINRALPQSRLLWCSLYLNRMTQCAPPTHWRAVEAEGKGSASTWTCGVPVSVKNDPVWSSAHRRP